MKRDKLIKKVASQLNLNEIEVADFIASVFDTMAAVLSKGRNINIPEFGKFIVREKTADGVACRYVTFSPSKKFAEEINCNFSHLTPVLVSSLDLKGLKEIRITESDGVADDADFVSFVFEDTETGIQFEAPVKEEETPVSHDNIVPIADEIPEDETADAPYLVPMFRSPAPVPPPEEKPLKVIEPPKVIEPVLPAEEISVYDLPETLKQDETLPETVFPESKLSEEITAVVSRKSAPVFEETEPDTEEIISAGEKEEEPADEVKEKDKAEIIEERIITEKEIILKDIEEYIKSKEETKETRHSGEEKEKDDEINYFTRANVFGEHDAENNFAVEDIKNSDIKPQNVFESEDAAEIDSLPQTEQQPEVELEQNVFSDLEDFFNSENGSQEKTEEPGTDIIGDKPISTTVENLAEADTDTKVQSNGKKQILLKDHDDDLDLKEEILLLLMSREKAIHDLDKYGPEISPEEIQGIVPEEKAKDDEVETPEEKESGTVTGDAGISGDIVFEEEKESIYDELNKRIAELEELSAKKEEIEEDLRKSHISPEMTIFEKLVDERTVSVPDKQAPVFPEIIIHDPGDKYEDKAPKSLSDALEDVNLDGVIEHLEKTPSVIEEKSYDDVFKPADIPFVPISNQEHVIKKQRKLLRFLLYFFFVVIFSMMSFFLYKSILTPNRKTPVDTLGVKINDSVAGKINLIDTELSKSSLTLNEFEVEKEGDIIYKQRDDGYIIQIAKFDKYSDALKYVSGLDNRNIHAEIERVDLPLNVTEYRIIIGTFETLQQAKSFFKTSGIMLNFIKVLTPFKTAMPF